MAALRLVLRLLLLVLATVVGYLVVILARLLKPLAPRLVQRVRNLAFRTWARIFCRLAGMRRTAVGPVPTGRFYLVSNHVSYVDIPLIAAYADAAFVAKADLRGWPVLGRIFATVDTIFIDRARKRDLLQVMERVEDSLVRGLGVVVFPEGTSSSGEGILRLKPSLLELPARRGDPVHYVTVSYRTPPGQPPARSLICWWDDTPFVKHFLRLMSQPRFEATVEFGTEPLTDRDRKALARGLREAMLRTFRPVC